MFDRLGESDSAAPGRPRRCRRPPRPQEQGFDDGRNVGELLRPPAPARLSDEACAALRPRRSAARSRSGPYAAFGGGAPGKLELHGRLGRSRSQCARHRRATRCPRVTSPPPRSDSVTRSRKRAAAQRRRRNGGRTPRPTGSRHCMTPWSRELEITGTSSAAPRISRCEPRGRDSMRRPPVHLRVSARNKPHQRTRIVPCSARSRIRARAARIRPARRQLPPSAGSRSRTRTTARADRSTKLGFHLATDRWSTRWRREREGKGFRLVDRSASRAPFQHQRRPLHVARVGARETAILRWISASSCGSHTVTRGTCSPPSIGPSSLPVSAGTSRAARPLRAPTSPMAARVALRSL